MSATSRVSALAPFQVRSFRFQWPADLATSWAFEMETLILSWYVLVETGSVLLLTVFASLLYTGTLLAPIFGVMADRVGHRNLLCAMRAVYATLATTLMTFIFMGVLTPVHVLVIATLTGIVRPSDLGMRAALVGETMPADRLMGAMSVQRTTQDSARIAGALTGAGLVATLGMGSAYLVVVSLYGVSFLLTLKAGGAGSAHRPRDTSAQRPSPWRDLRAGVAYVWTTPYLLAAMCIAFLVNLTAYPMVNGLLPYVAKAIYLTDQTGLGYLVASFAFGALLGAIVLSRIGHAIRPGRMMIIFCGVWFALLIVFAQMQSPVGGIPALMLAGLAQSLCMIPMSALLLRNTGAQFRGRIMGIRMLMIYGVPIGLLTSSPLIGRFGYPTTATLYCVIGLAFTLLIAVRWRADLWRIEAPANTR
ncbi:MAG: MFS transporter [Sulfuricaulis sp.]|nr:MFS transporter [Sulfuricaulis sp.]